jgi:hypothetical protein
LVVYLGRLPDACASRWRHAAEIGDRHWHALLDAHDAVVRSQLARFRGPRYLQNPVWNFLCDHYFRLEID